MIIFPIGSVVWFLAAVGLLRIGKTENAKTAIIIAHIWLVGGLVKYL